MSLLSVAVLAVSVGCPDPSLNPPTGTNPPPGGGSVSQTILDMEMATHHAINAERTTRFISALTMDNTLRNVARAHSQDMIDRDFFAHLNPDGDNVGERLTAAGVRYSMAGENIAWNRGFADPVAVAVDGWMDSPGHRANILRAEYSHTGIGIAVNSQNAYYFTQVFALPSKTLGPKYVEIYTYGPIAIEAW